MATRFASIHWTSGFLSCETRGGSCRLVNDKNNKIETVLMVSKPVKERVSFHQHHGASRRGWRNPAYKTTKNSLRDLMGRA